jgi:SH3-like domain-containing protein
MARVALRWAANLAAAIVVGAAASSAHAADYQSIGADSAILYDAPTARGNRLAIAPPGMPVEVILVQGDWVRIRDAQGFLAWVERRAVSANRTAIVNGSQSVDVLAQPSERAPVVVRVAPGVLLDVTSPPANGWVAVRHRDGLAGFVRVGNVWGS